MSEVSTTFSSVVFFYLQFGPTCSDHLRSCRRDTDHFETCWVVCLDGLDHFRLCRKVGSDHFSKILWSSWLLDAFFWGAAQLDYVKIRPV